MSYSFDLRAASKSEAKAKVAAELAKVVEQQPVHGTDRPQAQAAADAFIDLLGDDQGLDVAVHMHGSVSTHSLQQTTGAAVGVSAWLVPRG